MERQLLFFHPPPFLFSSSFPIQLLFHCRHHALILPSLLFFEPKKEKNSNWPPSSKILLGGLPQLGRYRQQKDWPGVNTPSSLSLYPQAPCYYYRLQKRRQEREKSFGQYGGFHDVEDRKRREGAYILSSGVCSPPPS
ncbi:hypothetical protein TNCV_1800021 [Trichonephila clavipes]|nr:hypothetical protein TNCV_1800021 [Trichonephila clavipes]